ncbi:MAG: hypothetical protein HYZ75_14815 [Elusimicrobia bacterium]|nr:hypothetical protein [Elusimicrobiota bacterium]
MRTRRAALAAAVLAALWCLLRSCRPRPAPASPPAPPTPAAAPAPTKDRAEFEEFEACWKAAKKPFSRAELLARTSCQPPFGIRVDRPDYTPAISVEPGIGMTAQVPKVAPKDLKFRWRADFGRFLSWEEPDFVVRELGTDVSNAGGTLYWTYDPALGRAEKPPVHVILDAVSPDGRVLATAGALILWQHDMAVVTKDGTLP